MKYIRFFFSITLAIFAILKLGSNSAHAQVMPASDQMSGDSAQLSVEAIQSGSEHFKLQAKREAMKRVLNRYNSPLVDHIDSFIVATERYELDEYFLISIAGVESSFANRMIPGTYNAYGYGKGTIAFDSWEHGIDTLGFKLRNNYINKGATTVELVGPRYAGGSSTWAPKIRHFMAQFEREEKEYLDALKYL